MEGSILSTVTGELVYQLAAVVISVVTTILGVYAKNWLRTSATAKKYELDNNYIENVLNNAVLYAEQAGKRVAAKGIEKQKLAYSYIDTIDKGLVKEQGNKLEMMLDRKVATLVNERLAIKNS